MDDRRKAAIRRLRARRGFRQPLVLYAAVNGFLVLTWAITDGGDVWPTWRVVWGILLALHGWRAYGERPTHGFLHAYGERPINEAEIQREMKKGDAAYPPEP